MIAPVGDTYPNLYPHDPTEPLSHTAQNNPEVTADGQFEGCSWLSVGTHGTAHVEIPARAGRKNWMPGRSKVRDVDYARVCPTELSSADRFPRLGDWQ